jgi:hypothetical protein
MQYQFEYQSSARVTRFEFPSGDSNGTAAWRPIQADSTGDTLGRWGKQGMPRRSSHAAAARAGSTP